MHTSTACSTVAVQSAKGGAHFWALAHHLIMLSSVTAAAAVVCMCVWTVTGLMPVPIHCRMVVMLVKQWNMCMFMWYREDRETFNATMTSMKRCVWCLAVECNTYIIVLIIMNTFILLLLLIIVYTKINIKSRWFSTYHLYGFKVGTALYKLCAIILALMPVVTKLYYAKLSVR